MTTFDAPGACTLQFCGTTAYAINPAGTVTGFFTTHVPGVGPRYLGFLRTLDGQFVTFDPHDPQSPGGFATGFSISPAGAIAGYAGLHGFDRDAPGLVSGRAESRSAPSPRHAAAGRATAGMR